MLRAIIRLTIDEFVALFELSAFGLSDPNLFQHRLPRASSCPSRTSRSRMAAHPKELANTAKHLAFTHCGELNLCGMVDAQISVLEAELIADALAA